MRKIRVLTALDQYSTTIVQQILWDQQNEYI